MKKAPLKRKTPLKAKPHLTKDGRLKPGYKKSGKSRVKTIQRRIDRNYMGPFTRAIGECFAEGVNGWQCSQRFENCHIIRRGEPSLFCHPDNLVCMCNVHHRFFTSHEHEWREFVESRLPGRWDALKAVSAANKGKKQDWEEWERFWIEKTGGDAA